jgi:hypothetical protein
MLSFVAGAWAAGKLGGAVKRLEEDRPLVFRERWTWQVADLLR